MKFYKALFQLDILMKKNPYIVMKSLKSKKSIRKSGKG